MRVGILVLVGMVSGAPAFGQQTYGNVEFRWRERALGLGDATVLPQGAAGVANPARVDQTLATLTNADDARFTLILEARVRRSAAFPDLRGLLGAVFDVRTTDSVARSTFARTPYDLPGPRAAWPDGGNALLVDGSQSMYGFNVGSGPDNYLPFPTGGVYTNGSGDVVNDPWAGRMAGAASGDRGIYGLYRGAADSPRNSGGIGSMNLSTLGNNLMSITLSAKTGFFSPYVDNPDGDPPFFPGVYAGRSDFFGLDTWIPVYALQYNVADVTTPRSIVLSTRLGAGAAGTIDLLGFRGVTNSFDIDSWPLAGSVPSYTITVVPGPAGLSALAGLGLLGARRRRA